MIRPFTGILFRFCCYFHEFFFQTQNVVSQQSSAQAYDGMRKKIMKSLHDLS